MRGGGERWRREEARRGERRQEEERGGERRQEVVIGSERRQEQQEVITQIEK